MRKRNVTLQLTAPDSSAPGDAADRRDCCRVCGDAGGGQDDHAGLQRDHGAPMHEGPNSPELMRSPGEHSSRDAALSPSVSTPGPAVGDGGRPARACSLPRRGFCNRRRARDGACPNISLLCQTAQARAKRSFDASLRILTSSIRRWRSPPLLAPPASPWPGSTASIRT